MKIRGNTVATNLKPRFLVVSIDWDTNKADYNALQIQNHILSGGSVVLYDPMVDRRVNFSAYDASGDNACALFVTYGESPSVQLVYYVWDDGRFSTKTEALVTEELLQETIGDIDSALDSIIAIQNLLIGGGGE